MSTISYKGPNFDVVGTPSLGDFVQITINLANSVGSNFTGTLTDIDPAFTSPYGYSNYVVLNSGDFDFSAQAGTNTLTATDGYAIRFAIPFVNGQPQNNPYLQVGKISGTDGVYVESVPLLGQPGFSKDTALNIGDFANRNTVTHEFAAAQVGITSPTVVPLPSAGALLATALLTAVTARAFSRTAQPA